MRYALPFGTFLSLGALVASLVGEPLVAWYLSFYPDHGHRLAAVSAPRCVGGLVGLVGILVFAVMKLRRAGRETSAGAERLSEEAFAAATIQAALPASRPPVAPATRPAAGAAGWCGQPRRRGAGRAAGGHHRHRRSGRDPSLHRPGARVARHRGPGTGHPFRTVLARWPAIADGLASAHAGEPPAPFVVLTESAAAPSPRVTVAITRWTPRSGRGGAVAMLGTGLA